MNDVAADVAADDRAGVDVDAVRFHGEAGGRADALVERELPLAEPRSGAGLVHDQIAARHDDVAVDLDAVRGQEHRVAHLGRQRRGRLL